ncbi:MAG: type II toxin-antitoxin system RelE/ParE family toxin [Proteobacteria bacterium]|nr:type II toxin-antitoxin system RelE/ParE family toxin [Pseudomonadota bacterium]
MYRIEISKRADKQLRRIQRHKAQSIRKAIRDIAADPFAPRATVDWLSEAHGLHRLRAGRWHVIYALDRESRTLRVVTIETRGQVYKR